MPPEHSDLYYFPCLWAPSGENPTPASGATINGLLAALRSAQPLGLTVNRGMERAAGIETELAASCSCAILPQTGGKTVVICDELKLWLCCFCADLRSFRVRICPKTSVND